jgi:hypothetical protein
MALRSGADARCSVKRLRLVDEKPANNNHRQTVKQSAINLAVSFLILLFGGDCRAQNTMINDLVPDLFRYLERAPADRRAGAQRFSEIVIRPHPEIYNRPQVFKTDIDSLSLYVGALPRYLPQIRTVHEQLRETSGPVEQALVKLFPDLDRSHLRVYLMLSLFRFDGKVPDDDPHILLLGVDGIARFHGTNFPVRVLLSHELFHLYHFQVNPVPKPVTELPLYRQLWQEGLATYISQLLNPTAPLSDILLDPKLAHDGPPLIPAYARQLLSQLETADDSIAAEYFSYRRNSESPSRMGYLIGLEIARDLAKTKSLRELTRLRGGALRAVMKREVERLARTQRQSQRDDRAQPE